MERINGNKITGLFAALEISSSGLGAQRRRMNTIAENLANTSTTRTKEGGPYKRKVVRFFEMFRKATFSSNKALKGTELDATRLGHLRSAKDNNYERNFSGVRIETVIDKADPEMIYDPEHPDADETGYVAMPKINIITEMVDMISASRAYEANITAIKVTKDMARKALEI